MQQKLKQKLEKKLTAELSVEIRKTLEGELRQELGAQLRAEFDQANQRVLGTLKRKLEATNQAKAEQQAKEQEK